MGYFENAAIIPKNKPIRSLHIIIKGGVDRIGGSNKPVNYLEGDCFGEESIVFQRESDYEYISAGDCKIATIWGCEIAEKVQRTNR